MSNSPFGTFVNPENAKLLKEYLHLRTVDALDDWPEGLTPFGGSVQLEGYNAFLAAGRPFIFLTYLDVDGQPYLDKNNKKFQVVRFLGDVLPGKWYDKDGKPPPKVISPNDRGNELHFEPIRDPVVNWNNLPEGSPILHVESLVKAKAVHKATGIPCVGYNGIDSWSGTRKKLDMLHQAYPFKWHKYKNIILFDSNVTNEKKPQIRETRRRLMSGMFLHLKCPEVYYVDLPKFQGEDIGPDDFIFHNGGDALFELIKGCVAYEHEEHSELVDIMNEKAYFVKDTAYIVSRENHKIYTLQNAKALFAPINKQVPGRSKNSPPITIYAIDKWMDSEHRNWVDNIDYRYLDERIVEDQGKTYYNIFIDDGAKPGPDWKSNEKFGLVLKHLERMLGPKLELVRSYIRFIKYTNEKPTSFPVLYSDKRGAGKGWLGRILRRQLGPSNCNVVSPDSFTGTFNAQMGSRRLIFCNEFQVDPQDRSKALRNIKIFSGDDRVEINEKNKPIISITNQIGMFFTCNDPDDVPADGLGDRRMFYANCDGGAVPENENESYWAAIFHADADPECMSAMAKWIEEAEEINFASWRPPLDAEREGLLLSAMGPLDQACHDLLVFARERGLTAYTLKFAKMLIARQGSIPYLDRVTDRTLAKSMKASGWFRSEKKAGKTPADQTHVWLTREDQLNWSTAELVKARVEAEKVLDYK